jgi:hypothetical protein
MVPQERGLEGIIFIPILITIFSKGGDRLHEIIGEGQEVLDSPRKILKPIPGLIVGLVVGSFTPSLLHSYHSFPHTLFHSLTHSLIHPHLRLGLEKGKELPKTSHGTVGCSGRWCDLAMT